MVGATGFEPATSWTQTTRSSQAELRSELMMPMELSWFSQSNGPTAAGYFACIRVQGKRIRRGWKTRSTKAKAKIDYFATSLPTMLLFDDDLQYCQATTALFLQAQARLGLGQKVSAKKLLQQVLQRDPNHALANDLNYELS